MECPIDKSKLTTVTRDGVEIDYCPSCHGVWLDRGELDKIIDKTNEPLGSLDEKDEKHPGYPDIKDTKRQKETRNYKSPGDNYFGSLFDFQDVKH